MMKEHLSEGPDFIWALRINLAGTSYAIGNTCTHMGCPLPRWTLKGGTVQCACHGSVFNVKSSEVVRGLAEEA